ncbi:MAG TPA: hypothetical protein VGG13_03525 [Candidatus Saccharimonadales bacterium]
MPELGTAVAWSSPLHSGHTFLEKEIRLAKRFPYPGGLFSKILVEIYQRLHEADFKLSALGHSALGALVDSPKGCPPALWSSQIRLLAEADSLNPETPKRIITKSSTLIHVGDEADHRVKIPAARSGIRRIVEENGGTFVALDMPGTGHANITGTRRAVFEVLSESGLLGSSVKSSRYGMRSAAA